MQPHLMTDVKICLRLGLRGRKQLYQIVSGKDLDEMRFAVEDEAYQEDKRIADLLFMMLSCAGGTENYKRFVRNCVDRKRFDMEARLYEELRLQSLTDEQIAARKKAEIMLNRAIAQGN